MTSRRRLWRTSPGRPLRLDDALERRIGEIIARFARRWNLDPEALQIANRKQAMVPEGAVALDPVGTAPGLVPAGEQVVVVLPGPPRELQESWMQAVETEPFGAVAAPAPRFRQTMMRLFGIPESEIAETLRVADDQIGLDGLEVTTCLRRGELEIVIRADRSTEPSADARGPDLGASRRLCVLHRRQLDRGAGDAPARGPAAGEWESCTGGLLAARLTDRPGSSDYFAGSVVAYSNEAKSALLGVPPETIERHGAVSEEVAVALADGALRRFAADTAIGLTGIAGPDGGTPDKPVGRVCFCVVARRDGEDERVVRAIDIPGSRAEVRDRSTVALHLLRRLLREAAPV